MTVLIAIPCWNTPGELVDKAVRHALAQTYKNLVVMVVGDGQRPPVSVIDDRLVVRAFPTHRGAPFVQQAMILGNPYAWYAPHGSDDWTEPNHIASLLALKFPVQGSGAIYYHAPGKTYVYRSSRTFIEFGVLDNELLRSIGGYNAAEPCGQDSVLISILVGTAGRRLTSRPTYHKLERADSLTHHPDTRGGSPLRTGVRERNRVVLQACERIGWKHRERIRAYRASLVPAELRTELEDRAADVAKWLS